LDTVKGEEEVDETAARSGWKGAGGTADFGGKRLPGTFKSPRRFSRKNKNFEGRRKKKGKFFRGG